MTSLQELYNNKDQAVKGLLFSSLGIGLAVAGVGTGIGFYLLLRVAERLKEWGLKPGETMGRMWSKMASASVIIFCLILSYSSYRLLGNFIEYWSATNDIEASMCQMWERRGHA